MGILVVLVVFACMYAHSAISGDSIGDDSSHFLSELQLLSIANL